MQPRLPTSPRLFLVDGYALIYRAFFALISRPLTTSRGENTSAAWGVVNFLQRLLDTHRPDYLGWVHDSGLSFRHEHYPAYKATREKLGEELQADFDRGMERIAELLEAFNVPCSRSQGYEADDVIGTLARQGVDAGVQRRHRFRRQGFLAARAPGRLAAQPGPRRTGERRRAVGRRWRTRRATRRAAAPRHRLSRAGRRLVRQRAGSEGIGDKTARELVSTYGALENILEHAAEITKKRPREALLEHEADGAALEELVTIREDLDDAARARRRWRGRSPITRGCASSSWSSSSTRSRRIIAVERAGAWRARRPATSRSIPSRRSTRLLERVTNACPTSRVDTETVIEPAAPQIVDPLRSHARRDRDRRRARRGVLPAARASRRDQRDAGRAAHRCRRATAHRPMRRRIAA